jgi:6-phosphogluconolactonase
MSHPRLVENRLPRWAPAADTESIVNHIDNRLSRSGKIRLAVPGGTTPAPIFELLAKRPIAWNRITLMLTDDRLVPANHEASNHGKLTAAFRKTPAHIVPLEQGAPVRPFDMVWLGMGKDGHIASLFPAMQSEFAEGPAVVKTVPTPLPAEAPFERLSLNLPALINTREIILVVRGQEKKHVLDEAIRGVNDLPVTQLFADAQCPITLFWSEQ